jgi:DNA replication protein DnaC
MILQNGQEQDSPSQARDLTYTCEECGKVVEPLLIDFPLGKLGGSRYVRRRCPCQVQKSIEAVEKAKNYERQTRYERYFAYSTLGNRFISKTFENYIVTPQTSPAFKESKKFVQTAINAQTDEERARGVMLIGPVGTGKSHLAAAVFNMLKDKKTCIFVNIPELLDKIMASYQAESNEKEEDILNAIKQCDILILDDIGAERHKGHDDWATQKLFTVIDSRYRNMRPIFSTTNCVPHELEAKIGSRIMSRLREVCVLTPCSGEDYRKQLASGRGA